MCSMPLKLRTFPAADTAFTQEVLETCRTVLSSGDSPDDLGSVLQRRLRRHYPNAMVRIQDSFAQVGPTVPIIYAFRDRAVRPPNTSREALYRALSSARDTVRSAEEILDQSEQLLLDFEWGTEPSDVSPPRRPDPPHSSRSRSGSSTDPG
jgi:hypothetical protein